MSVFNVLNDGLLDKLAANSTLIATLGGTAIYYQHAPDGEPYPYVVLSHQAGGPDNINPSDLRSMSYYVRGYSTSRALAGSIDALCSASLHKQALTVSGYTNFWTVRETDVAPPPEITPAGGRVYAAGGFYRIRLDS